MKRILIVFIVIIVFLTSCSIYLSVEGNPYKKKEIASRLEMYLLKEKGYKGQDIKSISGIKGNLGYNAAVVYNDEPDVIYIYFENNNNQLEIGGIGGTGGDKDKSLLKHFN